MTWEVSDHQGINTQALVPEPDLSGPWIWGEINIDSVIIIIDIMNIIILKC